MKITAFLLLFLGFNMCSDKRIEPKQIKPTEIDKPTICIYNYETAKVSWTFYKATEKLPLENTFTTIKAFNFKIDSDLLTAIEGGKLALNTKLISYNNSKNSKLSEYLFGKMMESNIVTIKIIKLDRVTKKATIKLHMNNTEKLLTSNYTINNNNVILQGNFDLIKDFDAAESLYFYKTACSDEHKGKDGKSKTWSEVSYEIVLELKEQC